MSRLSCSSGASWTAWSKEDWRMPVWPMAACQWEPRSFLQQVVRSEASRCLVKSCWSDLPALVALCRQTGWIADSHCCSFAHAAELRPTPGRRIAGPILGGRVGCVHTHKSGARVRACWEAHRDGQAIPGVGSHFRQCTQPHHRRVLFRTGHFVDGQSIHGGEPRPCHLG